MKKLKETEKDVHTEHCCAVPGHGCKYGDENCPVVTGRKPQSFVCETCMYEDGIKDLATLNAVVKKKIKTCPYCMHVLP